MLDAIRVDWEQRYGIVPQLVETFVVRSGSLRPTGYPRSGLANTGASTCNAPERLVGVEADGGVLVRGLGSVGAESIWL